MIKFNLSFRIFNYFLIVILISLVATAYLTYLQSSNQFDQYMKDNMSQTINNAMHHTNKYLEEYDRTILSMLSNDNIKKFVATPNNERYDHYHYGAIIRETAFKDTVIRIPEIASIYLISEQGQNVSNFGNSQGLYNYNLMFKPTEIYELLDENINKDGQFEVIDYSAVNPAETSILTLTRRVSSFQNVFQYQGFIAIEIHKNELEGLWKGIDLGENGFFFVVNNQGKVIYHPQRDKIGTSLAKDMSNKLQASSGLMFTYDDGSGERTLFSRHSDYAGWNLVVSVPMSELRQPIDSIRTNTIIVSVVMLLVAMLFALRFGRSIVKPIHILKQGMEETEKGKWVQLPLTGRKDEMDDLTRRYNLMVKRLSDLIDQVYTAELKDRETQVERQKAELQALQLQVNPHFLYNTLETIACYAVIQDSKEITVIVKYLADMFRYSVKTDLEEVTIANELKHVLNYMTILNYRTGWNFEIIEEIPPEYLLRNMVRLTLQPLVENAFQHAFPDGLEEHHYIRIRAYMQDDEFIVSVEDNGVGISEQRLTNLTDKLKENKLPDAEPGRKSGIGILNVHRRIQMVFGEKYGLSIESVPQAGARMLLRMPRYPRQGDISSH